MTAVAAAETSRSKLPDLIALACEPSSDKRRELLRQLTDHLFGTPSNSPAEVALYDEVMTRLAADMEAAVRAELAKRFARVANAPKGLVRRLARDELLVAAPLLEASPALSEQDLIDVVSNGTQDHLRAVSRRETLSEPLSQAIVRHADNTTLGHLLRNEGASFSRETAEEVVERAMADTVLHEATIGRASLPIDLLNDMYFVVEQRLRQQILKRNGSLDTSVLEQALSRGRTRVAANDGVLPSDYDETEAYVAELSAAGQLRPPTLARLLRSGSRTPFLIALTKLAGVDFLTAKDIVDRRQIDALAVVCRAAQLDRSLFLTFAVVLLGNEDNALGKANGYGQMYAELKPDTALRTVRFWKMRREARAA